jgi:hypothetical protein
MRHKGKAKTILTGVTALMLVSAPLYGVTDQVEAATNAPPITAVSRVIKPIYISAKSYINLVDVGLVPSDDGQIASYTLSIYNGGNSTLDLSDYWFRLSNASGASFSLKTASNDAKLTKVPAGSKVFITLYAKVGNSVKLSDLTLKVVKFDFSVAGYEKTIGNFTLPSNYTNNVAAGSYKILYSNTTQLNTKIASASVGTSGDYNYVTIDFIYNNIGKKSITLSKYKYYVVTSQGIMYEAKPSLEGDLVLEPLKRTELKLTAEVPATLKTTIWRLLVVREDGSTETTTLPVGLYGIKFNQDTVSKDSDSFTYSNSTGTYQFELVQLRREPLENQDVLSAKIRILNKSVTSIPLPNISGYFYLDKDVKIDFTPIEITNQLGLNPGDYVDVDVYAKLPINYSFKTATLIVNNKQANAETATKIGELTGNSSSAQIPVYAVDQGYTISRDGSNMTATINDVNTYKSATQKVFRVQTTLTNNEKRAIDAAQLVGYFKSDSGDIFPATASTTAGKVSPANKALVTFTASVPLEYDTANLRLIVGEGVTDKSYATSDTKATAYVNAVSFNLPAEANINTDFQNVSLLPYTFSINAFTPTIMGDNVQITMNYDLLKDAAFNIYPTDRKLELVIDGIDSNTGKTYTYFTKELTFESSEDTNTLIAGTNNEATFSVTNNYSGLDGGLSYKVRLYEIVNGAKKLIAERPLGFWYLENKWSDEAGSGN